MNENIPTEEAVLQVRKECRQFAMLYFHFCKTLVEQFGEENAKPLVIRALLSLSRQRVDGIRKKADQLGLAYTPESFNEVNDLPNIGWVKELGREHCPYAVCWRQYFDAYPWFRSFAPLYCNVIDTNNIEYFTGNLSHRLTKNVLTGDDTCERIYFESPAVHDGKYTYTEPLAD